MGEKDAAPDSYFDGDYYQAGHKKGTLYSGYLQNALESKIYRGMARAIMAVFRPARVLEIGCAAGPIVKHLNDMGCDAHGIDVSEWAVRNRFHPNVIRASAHDLPYEDRAFDLVFSAHALEHLPDAIADGAFAEMSRVAAGHQFHMLPILGMPPYDGPVEAALAQLRRDPTHNQLHERAWWLDAWSRHGWRPVPANILLDADNTFFEFSICQLLLSRTDPDPDLLRAVQEFNLTFFKRVSLWDLHGAADPGRKARAAVNLPAGIAIAIRGAATPLESRTLSLRDGAWADLGQSFAKRVDLRGASLYLHGRVDAAAALNLRVAAVTFKEGVDSTAYDPANVAGVAQLAVEFPPGDSVVELEADDFSVLYGAPRPEDVSMLLFGGESPFPADVECICVLKTPSGVRQLFGPELPCDIGPCSAVAA